MGGLSKLDNRDHRTNHPAIIAIAIGIAIGIEAVKLRPEHPLNSKHLFYNVTLLKN